ncbi:MAG: hypothetical protein KGL39_06400 [Patescibacteria group bacterium]|nr:hypothetical protein [Patescibacteria group bacterium]
MDYAGFVTEYSTLLAMDSTDPLFTAILPGSIDYGEQRCYRELDLLNTVTRDTGTLTVGTRSFTLPSNLGRFVVTNGINVITPSSTTTPDDGTRNPLVPCSRDLLDMIWPSTTGAGVPSAYAPITDQQFIVGRAPDAAYTAEVIGTIRPTPLGAGNTTTYLTLYLPDLFVAACMIFGSGYQKNFGAQSDTPPMGMSWETQYERLFASANVEEQRKRFASGAWGSLQPTTIATPTRP